MPPVISDITQLIGGTPMLTLERYAAARGLDTAITLMAKLEYLNPAGSIKDRVALSMVEQAESSGALTPGGCIIEPTSGNTGIGLAMVARARGYRVVLTMPETMSVERRSLLAAYGAELVLTPGSEGMSGAIRRARELVAKTPGAFMPGQFENPANPDAHYRTTGPEIWRDTEGRIDVLVAGVGTGGTITGTGRYLREQNPNIKIVAVEPADSPVLSQGRSGPHGIQGIGAGFIPENLNKDLLSAVVPVKTQDAYAAARALTAHYGLLCGISSGAALHGAVTYMQRHGKPGQRVAVILPDSGERYLSTPLFGDNG